MLARSIRSHYVITYLLPQIKAQFAYESQSGVVLKEKKGRSVCCFSDFFFLRLFFLGELYARLHKEDVQSTSCDDSENLEDDKYCTWVVDLFLDMKHKAVFGN